MTVLGADAERTCGRSAADGIAITGLATVTPLGTLDELFARWCAGETAVVDGIGRCGIDLAARLSLKEIRRSNRATQFALVAADEALAQAGVSSDAVDLDRVGCLIGTCFGGQDEIEVQQDVFRERGGARISPLAVPLSMHNAIPSAIAIRHGLRGPAHSVGSACAAGADAIAMAVHWLRAGIVDIVVAGGADSALSDFGIAVAQTLGAVSPSGVGRPFDVRRDGFVMGEGAGVLVLERRACAERRGAVALAEIAGVGASTDAHHLTIPDPTGRVPAIAIGRALADAGVGPEEVHYVNAHGTSTQLNDRTEGLALHAALGAAAAHVPVSSSKSAIGHIVGGAGAIEAAVTIASLRAGIAPPSVGLEQVDEEIGLTCVHRAPQPLAEPRDGARVGLSNSFGFGGHNAVLCLRAAAAEGAA